MWYIFMLFLFYSDYCMPLIQHDALFSPVPEQARLLPNELQELRNQNMEEQAGLFEGDIVMDDKMYKYWRVGFRKDAFPEKFWPNGTVPYVICESYSTYIKKKILTAIETIKTMTCIRFIPWNGHDKDFIHIQPPIDSSGCSSYIGRQGGEQALYMEPPRKNGKGGCFTNKGKAVHLFMHVLGTFHEQSRWDRDYFIIIHKDNILPRYRENFKKQPYNKAFTKYVYDYNSVMHYGNNFFAKDRRKPTITPKQKGANIGQRCGMSVLDCLKLNDLYDCMNNDRALEKYHRICNSLGIK